MPCFVCLYEYLEIINEFQLMDYLQYRQTNCGITILYHIQHCTTFHRYPIFSTRYSVMCKVYTGYCGTSEIEHGLCACTVDNPIAKARGLSLRTGAQPMLYLPHVDLIVCDFRQG